MATLLDQLLNNRYKITALLGEGAMGEVYRATDQRTGQDVAVKVVTSKLALEPEMLARFQREGEALQQLRHPNIVGFVEMFQHAGQQMIVMEYMPGGSLLNLIRRGPLPAEQARRIALELCDALTRAHHLNVIHRDIKPENVLLAQDGTPKLTDFGVARLMAGTRLTGTGTQVGTPYYMAPEAWEGKPLDGQADIWSLGVVLYEMLTGEVPFGGDTAAAVMTKVLMTTPDLPKLRAELPASLAPIVTRMLTRDKAARYQSMREVGLDLERGAALAASAPTAVAARPARRWPRWVLGAAVVGVLGVMLWISLPVAMKLAFPAREAMTATQVVTPLAQTASSSARVVTPTAIAVLTPGNAEQARAFAAPLLAAIASRPPDFSDDFSDPDSGWSSASNANGDRWGYEAGVFSVTCARSLFCGSTSNRPVPNVSDYVMEVDAQFVAGDWGSVYIGFLNVPAVASQLKQTGATRFYAASVWPDGAYQLGWKSADSSAMLVSSQMNSAFVPGPSRNRLTFVVQGAWIALYVNGTPVTLVNDNDLSNGRPTLQLGVGQEAGTQTPLVVQFDNLKIWDLAGDKLAFTPAASAGAETPATPAAPTREPTFIAVTPMATAGTADQARAFAAPLLAAIANRPADFSDDFSNPNSGWTSGSTESGSRWGYEAGIFSMSCAGEVWCGSTFTQPAPNYAEYVMEVQAQFVSGDWGAWSVTFLNVPATATQLQKVTSGRFYNVSFYPDGTYMLGWKSADHYALLADRQTAPAFVPANGKNQVRLIVRSPWLALYVNDAPVSLLYDEGLSQVRPELQFGVGREAGAQTPLVVHFDNVKIWDVSTLP